ncbi:MAG: 23S rRNA (uracil(1939)-C(5))-methyltransferase RlmD [Chlorobi bacterium]|nr:23S rRNA (uracil(1939)-C(5))-methyltransferase RlmD [Chlorobiota bacterium]
MGRSRKPFPLLRNLMVTDIGAGGKAIARDENRIVFISHAVPGDVVDVQIRKKRKNYLEGDPVKFTKRSNLRAEPFCEHFGVCGGCKWQDMTYPEQLHFKQKQVTDQLSRIAGLGDQVKEKITPILPSPQNTHYRNKLEFTFSSKRWLTREEIATAETITEPALGFHAPGLFDKVVDINSCHLQSEPSNAIRNFIRQFATEYQYPFYDIRNQKGLLRNLIIRTATTGEVMVVIAFFRNEAEKITKLMEGIRDAFPEITSLQFVINPKGNDTLEGLDVQTFSGRDHIIEKMDDLRFKIGPKSFFQTNTRQAENLYRVVAEFADISDDQNLYDLYSGTGTIALYLARKARYITGIETVSEAVADAVKNTELNGITNVSFITGDVKSLFNDKLFAKHGNPDTVILDPPRAGIHGDILSALLACTPGKIVYVSCNPSTQARDLVPLLEKYRVEKIQPVDMFPHTHHVENVVLLVRDI